MKGGKLMKIDLEKELKLEFAKINSLGFSTYDDIEISTRKLSSCFGYVQYHKFITLDSDFVKYSSLKEIRAVIAHEACHLIKFSSGHDAIWFKAVSLLAEKFPYDYEHAEIHLARPYSKERRNQMLEYMKQSENFSKMYHSYKYFIKCPNCGVIGARQRYSKKFFQSIELGLRSCASCHCRDVYIVQNY